MVAEAKSRERGDAKIRNYPAPQPRGRTARARRPPAGSSSRRWRSPTSAAARPISPPEGGKKGNWPTRSTGHALLPSVRPSVPGQRPHQRQHRGAGPVVVDRGESVAQRRELVASHAAICGSPRCSRVRLARQPLEEMAWRHPEVGGDLVEPPGADPDRPLLVLLDLREGQSQMAPEPPLADAEGFPAPAILRPT